MSASRERLIEVLLQSERNWSSVLRAIGDNEKLPLHSTNLSRLLGPIPRYLGGTSSRNTRMLTDGDGLYIRGNSSFQVNHGGNEVDVKIVKSQLMMATKYRTTFICSNGIKVKHWFPKCNEDNLITIMVLAWSYILSSCWVETIQQQDPSLACKMVYYPNILGERVLDCDKAGLTDPAWWNSIFVGSWHASLIFDGKTFYSPWNLRRSGTTRSYTPSTKFCNAPSSSQALDYLAELCAVYEVEEQCFASLSVCLFIPFLQSTGLNLPPVNRKLPARTKKVSTPKETIVQQLQLLPYYMTLSSDNWGLQALLQGTFYTDTISCNEVGAWLHPIVEAIDLAITTQECHKVGILMARRAPKLAPLWIGALLASAVEPIVAPLRLGLIAVSLPFAAWTSTRHSFIGPFHQPLKISCQDDQISRADEALLLYIAQENLRPPTTPWKPFGEIFIAETDLIVQQHLHCKSHSFTYLSWSLEGGSYLDPGYAAQTSVQNLPTDNNGSHTIATVIGEPPCVIDNEDMSRNATKAMFGWMRREGWPASERSIYEHEWFNDSDDDEYIDQDTSPIDSGKSS